MFGKSLIPVVIGGKEELNLDLKNWKQRLILANESTIELEKRRVMVEKELKEGDTWHNPPLQPHQLEALEPMSSVTEVSTADSVEDNYRLIPGDSQNLNPEKKYYYSEKPKRVFSDRQQKLFPSMV